MSTHRRFIVVALALGTTIVAACQLDQATGATGGAKLAGAAATSVGHQKQCDTVTILANTQVFAAGESVPLEWVVYDKNAKPLDKATVTWASDAPGVAAISAAGVLTALSPGAAGITATCSPFTGTGYFVAIVQ